MTRRQILILLSTLMLIGGCGNSATPPSEVSTATAQSGERTELSSPTLARELGNAFSQGLYRLAVMAQRGGEAADLGQDLPTGLVSSVRCRTPEVCEVRWDPRDGAPRSTRYRIDYPRPGCFEAFAGPPLPVRRDATIDTYSENPLNSLVSAREECS